MNAADALIAMAQVAMTLTGFAGLLTAFRRNRKLQPVERHAVRFLLLTSVSGCLFALLPLPMLAGGIRESMTWGICLPALGAWLLLLFAWSQRQLTQVSRPRIPVLYWICQLLGLLVGLVALASPVVAFGPGSPGIYLTGLGWLLLVSLLQLVLQVVRSLDN